MSFYRLEQRRNSTCKQASGKIAHMNFDKMAVGKKTGGMTAVGKKIPGMMAAGKKIADMMAVCKIADMMAVCKIAGMMAVCKIAGKMADMMAGDFDLTSRTDSCYCNTLVFRKKLAYDK